MNEGALGRVYASGEYVVRQGDKGDCMYVVQGGKLEVIREEREGHVRIGVMSAGDFFGEMAIFERDVRSVTVRALGEARVLTVDKRTFLRRIQEDPALAFNLVKIMSARIRALNAQVGALKPKSSPPVARAAGMERRAVGDRRGATDRRAGVERRAARP